VLYNTVIREDLLSESETKTLKKILEAGKKEFLQKGFILASLRNIVRNAEVTTGAFYGYFKSKEELFDYLVSKPANTCMEAYMKAQTEFALLPPEKQPCEMGKISGECMDEMVDYIYDNFDAFKLIICCSEGTRYENYIHDMVVVEVNATYKFMEVLKKQGLRVENVDSQLIHILASGMLSAYFEMVVHDMPREQAKGYVKELRRFYTAGWKTIMDF